jgi:hypothetical protein
MEWAGGANPPLNAEALRGGRLSSLAPECFLGWVRSAPPQSPDCNSRQHHETYAGAMPEKVLVQPIRGSWWPRPDGLSLQVKPQVVRHALGTQVTLLRIFRKSL